MAKPPIKGVPVEINRRFDDLDRRVKGSETELASSTISLDGVTSSTISVSAYPSDENLYEFSLSIPYVGEGGWNPLVTTENTATFVGLEPSQQYETRVRVVYPGSKSGEWSSILTTTTAQSDVADIYGDNEIEGDLYVNKDHVPGIDEDATIYFNDDDEYLRFDFGDDRFEFSAGIYSPEDIETDGNVYIDKAGDNALAYLYFRGTSEYLAWDNANTRFQLSDELLINATYMWLGPATSGDRYIGFRDDAGTHSFYWRTAGYWEVLAGGSFRLNQVDLHINSDYTSGDVDCTIYFNATNESFKFDYGNDRFELTNDLYVAGNVISTGEVSDSQEIVCHANAVICHANEVIYN